MTDEKTQKKPEMKDPFGDEPYVEFDPNTVEEEASEQETSFLPGMALISENAQRELGRSAKRLGIKTQELLSIAISLAINEPDIIQDYIEALRDD